MRDGEEGDATVLGSLVDAGIGALIKESKARPERNTVKNAV